MSNIFAKSRAIIESGRMKDEGITKRNKTKTQKQPATIRKLMKIDLDNRARICNIQLTKKAKRKLKGEKEIDNKVVMKPIKLD